MAAFTTRDVTAASITKRLVGFDESKGKVMELTVAVFLDVSLQDDDSESFPIKSNARLAFGF